MHILKEDWIKRNKNANVFLHDLCSFWQIYMNSLGKIKETQFWLTFIVNGFKDDLLFAFSLWGPTASFTATSDRKQVTLADALT